MAYSLMGEEIARVERTVLIVANVLVGLNENERIAVLDKILGIYCKGCGRRHPQGRKCQCDNEDL